MSSSKPTPYRLAPKAIEDMDAVWRYTAETWSLEQADAYIDGMTHAFQLIADMPKIARERTEFVPPVRIHVHQGHLVVYVLADGYVSVLRVLGGRQNWQAILQASEQ